MNQKKINYSRFNPLKLLMLQEQFQNLHIITQNFDAFELENIPKLFTLSITEQRDVLCAKRYQNYLLSISQHNNHKLCCRWKTIIFRFHICILRLLCIDFHCNTAFNYYGFLSNT